MKTPYLHKYDLLLCDYVRGNFASHLIGRDPDLDHGPQPHPKKASENKSQGKSPGKGKSLKQGGRRPRTGPFDDYRDLLLPDLISRWFYRKLPRDLWDYIAADRHEHVLFTDGDFESLASTAEDYTPPIPLLYWHPWPALHTNFIHCLPAIRTRLAPTAAEQFAEQSRTFGKQLEQPNLKLSDGTRLVQDWAGEIRRNLNAMGEDDLLPPPEGTAPTARSRGDGIPTKLRPCVDRIREAIMRHTELKTEKMSDRKIADKVSGKQESKLAAIKLLRERGELAK